MPAILPALLSFATAFFFSISLFGQYVMVNDASWIVNSSDSCVQLTAASNWQGGCAWSQNRIDFSNDFSLSLDFYFGNNTNGADGMTFSFQPVGPNVCGSLGGGLCASGLANTLSIEFDTYWNGWFDLSSDHTAIVTNGNVQSNPLFGPVDARPGGATICDGNLHNINIQWTSASNFLAVIVDGNVRLTGTYDFVTNTFGGNSLVYWGATGATGNRNNLQYFCPRTVVILPLASDLEAFCQGSSTRFAWQTPSKANLAHFEIEYSKDQTGFASIHRAAARPNLGGSAHYEAVLPPHIAQPGFYRLKTVDQAGHSQYSKTVEGGACQLGAGLILSVQNGPEAVRLHTSVEVAWQLIDGHGTIVAAASAENEIRISKWENAAGVYYLRAVTRDGRQEMRKLLLWK